MIRQPPTSTLFPYPPLFRSHDSKSPSHAEPPAKPCGERAATGCARGRRERRSGREPTALEHGEVSRSEEHTSELQSHLNLVCRLLLEKKNEQAVNGGTRRRA